MRSTFRSRWCAVVLLLPVAALAVPAGVAAATTARPPMISIGNAGVVEGDAGYRAALFNVVLSAPAAGKAQVFFVTASGTAVAGSDYAARSGTITFPGDATSAVIAIRVGGDAADEPDETFAVNLSNATGAVIANGSGIGTIANDDGDAGGPVATAGWTDPTVVFDSPVKVKVPVTLSVPQNKAVTLTLRGSCLPSASCLRIPGAAITLKPGQTERTLLFVVDPTAATEGRLRVRLTGGDVAVDTATRVSTWRSSSSASGLVLNEVDYDNVGGDTGEFVEVWNGNATATSLDGLAIALVNGRDGSEYRRVALTGTLPAGGYLVVADPGVLVASGARVVRFSLSHDAIQNGAPDGVALIDTVGQKVLDALSYEGAITNAQLTGFPAPVSLVEGTAATAEDSNTTQGDLARIPNGSDTGNADHDWALVTAPTPGAANHG
jgi:Calx-beta domain/Lamin Tail Domain